MNAYFSNHIDFVLASITGKTNTPYIDLLGNSRYSEVTQYPAIET